MTYIKQYIINQSPQFENELEFIYKYIAFKLNEPNTANEFYHKSIQKIYSLQYLPERYTRISDFKNKSRNLRKLLIDNYIIIYEVMNDTRTSLHFTYIS